MKVYEKTGAEALRLCGFNEHKPCTVECEYFNTCTRNTHKHRADQKEVKNEESKR